MQKKHLIFLFIAGALITFWPTFVWMFDRFNEFDSYYSHGYLIPLVTGFLLWRKREILLKTSLIPSNSGLFLLLAGLALHLVFGIVFKIGFVSGFAFIITLFGLSLYIFGKKISKIAGFPLFFLVFMVPLPKVLLIGITFRMKMMAAYAASHIISAMNIVIERAGSIIYLPNGVLTVGDECSGINSLISLFTLSVLFAYVTEESILKRSAFVIFSFPIALAANIARIVFLILAAYIYGVDAATKGFLHYSAGIVLWIAALIMLTLLWRLMKWRTIKQETNI